MQNNVFNIEKIHDNAAATILGRLLPMLDGKEKAIVTVAGEVASGKSPVSLCLGRLLKKEGRRPKLIDLDDFYLIHPKERREWREKHGIEKVGVEEINWSLLEDVIRRFHAGEPAEYPDVDLLNDKVDQHSTDFRDVDVLIIHGLYSLNIKQSDLKVYMEMTWSETMDKQRESAKEILDDFRLKVLKREQEAVMELKPNADVYIDLNTSMEIFHL